jgi:cell fate (sporulation/competence/biofilm development) regulator YlbF (YheA/YmcA/DUF963 family)
MFRALTPTLAIVSALLIFFLFIQPQYTKLQAVQQEIAEYEKATTDYANFRQKLEAFDTRRNSVSALERDRLDLFVPKEINATQSLVDLEMLAKQNLMLFGNISVADAADRTRSGADEDADRVREPEHADISFEVIGTYAQFKAFLAAIERSLTLFEVTNISATVGEGTFIQFGVTVRTYALPAVMSS